MQMLYLTDGTISDEGSTVENSILDPYFEMMVNRDDE